jgi:hypothetical protein
VDGHELLFCFETKVVEKLGCQWASGLWVPSLVKHCVVTWFDDAWCRVEVDDILVGGCVPKEYSSEVVVIKLATSRSWLPDTHARSKCLEVGHIRFPAIPALIRGDANSQMNEVVMQVHRMYQGREPEFGGEAGAI